MAQLNYHHLYYFYLTAKEGSIAKASHSLHLTPQTISAQIKTLEDYLGIELFNRVGKRLKLSPQGQFVYSYAEDIFGLGNELLYNLNTGQHIESLTFAVGVTDVIPKILTLDLFTSCFDQQPDLRLVCREGDIDSLLADLAINHLDIILSDTPIVPGANVKAYSHKIGESGMTFFAAESLTSELEGTFPQCLDQAPFLIPGDRSTLRRDLLAWFDNQHIHPRVVTECDDSALLKMFGQEGYGVFCTPTSIEEHVSSQYNVNVIGRTAEITESYYFISPERKLKHPAVVPLYAHARHLFD